VGRLTVVEIQKEENNFSAGHFTIFSATDREDLHGHNYYVSLALTVMIDDNGLAFDYRIYKRKLQALCKLLDRKFLLPSQSKYLHLEDTGDMWVGHYGDEKIPFLKRDVVILPITNVTIEELSHWFLEQLTEDKQMIAQHGINDITIKVFNGPGQSGSACCG
jgi:6-pyruvoyltetrahydropterin/6-carboxytetrahydropterin synthase